MKKTFIITALFILTIMLPGCDMPSKHSIEDVQNIVVAGLDMDGDGVLLTVLVDTMEKGQSTEAQKIGTKIYKAQGQTIFEAKRTLHQYTEKHISWDQLKYIIIGEATARQGIDRYLSFFCENEENKFTHEVAITKGFTASEFIEQANSTEVSLYDVLATLSKEDIQTGITSCVSLSDYAQIRLRPSDDLMLPTMLLLHNPVYCSQDNEPANFVKMEGYAIFRDDQLADFLDQESARALNIVLNKIKSTDFIVKDTNDNNAALELTHSTAKIKPDYQTLSATIEIQLLLNLVEFESDNTDQNYLHTLENNLNSLVEQQLQTMIDIVQRQASDVLLLGNAFYHENPEKWQEIKADWHTIFPTIPITAKVTSTIQCSYNLQNSIGG